MSLKKFRYNVLFRLRQRRMIIKKTQFSKNLFLILETQFFAIKIMKVLTSI